MSPRKKSENKDISGQERTASPVTDSDAGKSPREDNASRKIGTLNEKPLHEALKRWYAKPGDRFEVSVDGFIVDIVRGKLLIEIQTKNIGAMKRKLAKLLVHHRLRLIYPIASEKWIIRQAGDENATVSRRKSPKGGAFEDIFNELVSIPRLILHPHFSLELLLIQEEEVRRYDSTRGWRRRGWVTHERRLLKVVDHRTLKAAADMRVFIPETLPQPFTTSELADAISRSRRLARKMVYCLRIIGCVTPVGKRVNAILYRRADT